jgi:hypothetical protein
MRRSRAGAVGTPRERESVIDSHAVDRKPEIYVEYVVLMAGTAKVIGQGKVYLRVYRPGAGDRPVTTGIPVPVPIPGSRTFPEASLQQAGREVAERVMT